MPKAGRPLPKNVRPSFGANKHKTALMSLQGKIILITGASAGIGLATAVQLAQQGARLIALGRRQDALDALAAQFPAGQVRTMAGDLNDEAFVQRIDALAPELDVFVNNAGVLRYAPILELTPEDCQWMFQTNVLASLRVTQGIARGMVGNKRGHIVFMSSIAAREVYRLASVYCATKHALSALARSLRLELQSHGIKVTEVAPWHGGHRHSHRQRPPGRDCLGGHTQVQGTYGRRGGPGGGLCLERRAQLLPRPH